MEKLKWAPPIDASLDDVQIGGSTCPRPSSAGAGEWLAFWDWVRRRIQEELK